MNKNPNQTIESGGSIRNSASILNSEY